MSDLDNQEAMSGTAYGAAEKLIGEECSPPRGPVPGLYPNPAPPTGSVSCKMSFSTALEFLKMGARIARSGWNGKDMFLYLVPGQTLPRQNLVGPLDRITPPEANYVEVLSRIDMKAADGCIVIGWLASQTDMLSDDWVVLDYANAFDNVGCPVPGVPIPDIPPGDNSAPALTDIGECVVQLVRKAGGADFPDDALRFAQAASHLSSALHILNS